ncbi:MAG: TIM barrel protein [Candidatus Latescibacteria bacterium]|nr:TIM barrel protein [Candidatus Latescibacterota bacterium]
MRLGVVGMLPSDFRTIAPEHLDAIRALGLTGAAFHAPGDKLFDITDEACHQVAQVYAKAGMDLPQFGIGFGECLFDPDADARASVLGKIGRGLEVARALQAHTCLIRTGSLSPSGSYSPSPDNLTPQARAQLVDTLRQVAAKAETEGVTIVIETHVLTIMDSPETNSLVVQEVGSERIRIVMDYVNHFQSLQQVYNSPQRLDHIFAVMGPICPVAHCKDIRMRDGLVLHIDEDVPGEGVLDMAHALRLWHQINPDGYMLLEHLPNEKYPLASRNVHRIAAEAGIEIH